MAIVPGLFTLQAIASQAASAAVVPVVTNIGQKFGPPSGGTIVTVLGSGFTGVTEVDFGSNPGTNVRVLSSTLIFATAPAGSLGTVDVTVTNAAGTSSISPADHFTYANQAGIKEVSPDFGPAAGGSTVTISGAGFTGATSVQFGSILIGWTPATSFTVVSDSVITAVVPAGTNGIVHIQVQTPFSTTPNTALDEYTYVGVPPTVTSIFNNSGSVVGGTFVQITGTDFTGVSAVDFGSVPAASYTVLSPTLINAYAPSTVTATAPRGTPGTVDITVTNIAGVSSTSANDQYTYLANVPPCTTTIIGANDAKLTVTSGRTCLLDATQTGKVTVEPGAALSVVNSTINGAVTATSPSSVTYCGATQTGPLTVTEATGPVNLGNGCDPDTITGAVAITDASAMVTVSTLSQEGPLNLANNTAGIYFVGSQINGPVDIENNTSPAPVENAVMANTVNGPLDCSGNDPAPVDNGSTNTVSGPASGQCAAIAES